jgi:hypothetical protein
VARLTIVLALLIAVLFVVPSRAISQRTLARSGTVFGQGPEIHLLPNVGRVGTQVEVIGLGYRAGSRVQLFYGVPGAEFLARPLADAIVSARGTFRAGFIISCALVVAGSTNAQHPPRRCPLSPAAPFRAIVIGGFVDHKFVDKRTAVEGLIVTG